MQIVETTGKTVQDAIAAAVLKLDTAEENLTITVLDESKKLFGKSQVKIRAEKKVVDEPAPKKAPASKAPVAKAASVVAEVEEEAEAPKAKKPSRKKAEAEVAVASSPTSDSSATEDESVARAEVIATEEDGIAILAVVNELTSTAELEVEAKVSGLNGKYVTIELDGKDVAYLIGRHGEVLNAMQSLVNIISGRKLNNGVRSTLDGANYREKREKSLEEMATKIADEVKIRKEEAVIDALPAFERRIVHKVLSEMPGISTYSEGEEPNRHVVIAPKD